MNFSQMLTYFKMRDMIKEEHCLSSDPMWDDKDDSQTVRTIWVARDRHKHAKIIYRISNKRCAFVYADIYFTGIGSSLPDRVWIVNASLRDVKNQLIGYD